MNIKKIRIGNEILGDGEKTFVIAEAGVNHNGSIKIARQLVDIAVEAKASAIKFQTFRTSENCSYKTPFASYQLQNLKNKSTAYEMLRKLELQDSDFISLSEYCKKRKIIFFSTPFDVTSANFLKKINVPCYKIASSDVNNIRLVEAIAKFKKPIFISTGMTNLNDIIFLDKRIKKINKKIIYMHCISSYPTKFSDANLNIIKTLKTNLNSIIGYSDHTLGIAAPIAAVALGAAVIEKHFTLNKKLEGPDHNMSIMPEELIRMIKDIKSINSALGGFNRKIYDCEKNTAFVSKKSLVAFKDINKGTIIKDDMVIEKTPANGMSPLYLDKIIGRKAKKNIKRDQLINFSSLL
jgi:N,N'-diacetyllegionaminate synthase